jgi:uncharacterized protein
VLEPLIASTQRVEIMADDKAIDKTIHTTVDKTVDKTAEIDTEAHKIKFPCPYPIKVVGTAAEDFREYVVAVMERHAGALNAEQIDVRASSNGRFLSVRVTIIATGVEQLQTIFEELKASGRVHIVI